MQYLNKSQLKPDIDCHVLEIDYPGTEGLRGGIRIKYFSGKIKKMEENGAIIRCAGGGEAKLFFSALTGDIEFPTEAYSTECEAKERFAELLSSNGKMKIKKIIWQDTCR